MQCPRTCPGAATHRATSQPYVPISTNPRSAGAQAPRLAPSRALHLRHNGPGDQQPVEMSPEAGAAATTTLPMQQQRQQQRSVGDAMWTVWSGTQQFAGNVLSSWSSREASADGIDNAAVPSSSGRARLLKDAAESGKMVRAGRVTLLAWMVALASRLPACMSCAGGACQCGQTDAQPGALSETRGHHGNPLHPHALQPLWPQLPDGQSDGMMISVDHVVR